jgi:hypothetical protein
MNLSAQSVEPRNPKTGMTQTEAGEFIHNHS